MKHCFYNVHIDEDEQDFDEDIAPSQAPSLIEENDTMSNEESLPCHIAIEDGVLKKRKVVEFRDELKRRKESTTGNKAALVERLKKALDEMVPAYPLEISKPREKASNAKKGMFDIADGSWWKVLESGECVNKPTNPTFKNP